MSIVKKIGKIEKISDKYKLDFAQVLLRAEARVKQAAKDGIWDAGAIDSALVRDQLRGILSDSKIDGVIASMTGGGYQDILAENVQFYNDLLGESLKYQAQSLERLNRIKEIDLEKFDSMNENAIREMERIIINAEFGQVPRSTLADLLANSLDSSMGRYAETLVDTAISGFNRVAGQTIARDGGIEFFQYAGPMDSITRPFCEEHFGEIRKWDEWDAMENDFGQKVTIYCGGYNCRHELIAVLKDGEE